LAAVSFSKVTVADLEVPSEEVTLIEEILPQKEKKSLISLSSVLGAMLFTWTVVAMMGGWLGCWKGDFG